MVKIGKKSYVKISPNHVRNTVSKRPVQIGSPTYNKLIDKGWIISGTDGHKTISPPSKVQIEVKVEPKKKSTKKKVEFEMVEPKVSKKDKRELERIREEFKLEPKLSKKEERELERIRKEFQIQPKQQPISINPQSLDIAKYLPKTLAQLEPEPEQEMYQGEEGYQDYDQSEAEFEEPDEEPEYEGEEIPSDEDIIQVYRGPKAEEEYEGEEGYQDIEEASENELANMPVDELNDMLDALENKQIEIITHVQQNIANPEQQGIIERLQNQGLQEIKEEIQDLKLPEFLEKVMDTPIVQHNPQLQHKVELLQDALKMEEELENIIEEKQQENPLEVKELDPITNAVNMLYVNNDLTSKELSPIELTKVELYINNLLHDHRVLDLSEENLLKYINAISQLITNHKNFIKDPDVPMNIYLYNLFDFIRFLKKKINLIIEGVNFSTLEEMYMNPEINKDYENKFIKINDKINMIDLEIKEINDKIDRLHEAKESKHEEKKIYTSKYLSKYANAPQIYQGFNAPSAPSFSAPDAPPMTPLTEEEKQANREAAEARRQANILQQATQGTQSSFIPTQSDLTSMLAKLKKAPARIIPEPEPTIVTQMEERREVIEPQESEIEIPEYEEGAGLRFRKKRRNARKMR